MKISRNSLNTGFIINPENRNELNRLIKLSRKREIWAMKKMSNGEFTCACLSINKRQIKDALYNRDSESLTCLVSFELSSTRCLSRILMIG